MLLVEDHVGNNMNISACAKVSDRHKTECICESTFNLILLLDRMDRFDQLLSMFVTDTRIEVDLLLLD